MQAEAEQSLIKKFVNKDKQERYLRFVAKEKTRWKFLNELHYFKDFNWKLLHEIPGNENVRDAIIAKVKGKKDISSCYVISYHSQYDGKLYSVDNAINNLIGIEEIILIFGNADIVYYEGEAPNNRYLSI